MVRLISVQKLAELFRKEKLENFQIKPIGGRYVLVTFNSQEVRDSFLKEKCLQLWFDEFNPWNGESASMERFVWLNCYGLPLNGWNMSTFRAIGNHWGHFMGVDSNTLKEVSYEAGRILIATDVDTKIEDKLQVVIQDKEFLVKVEEMETFRVFKSNYLISDPGPNEEDNDGVKTKNAKVTTEEKDQPVNDTQAVYVDMAKSNVIGGGCNGNGDEAIKDCMVKAFNEKDIEQLSKSPRQDNHSPLDLVENNYESISNSSPGLDSFVADSFNTSNDPIMIVNQDCSKEYEETKSAGGGKSKSHAITGKNLLCPDGPIVLDSNNSIRPSQLPSINLQVELNPKEARKILRKRIREEASSPESSEFIRNTLNEELEATAEAGRIIGVGFSNTDLLVMEKLIGKESNRFALLQRSTPN